MLSPEEIEKLRPVMAMAGWREVMRPVIQNHGIQMTKVILTPPSERPGAYKEMDDNILRGEIRACEWMMSVWQNEIKVYDHNQKKDEEDRREFAAEGNSLQPA